MCKLEAEKCLYSLAGKLLDLIELACLNKIVLNHKASAAAKDLIELEVRKDVVLVKSACRHKLNVTVGSAHCLKHGQTACSFCGEKLNCIKSKLNSRLDIRGRGASGDNGNVLLYTVCNSLGVQAGAYDKGSTCFNCRINLSGGKNCSGTHYHIGECGCNVLNSLCRTCGTEGDLRSGKSAVYQCFCKGYCIVGIFDLDNGNNTDFIQLLINFFHDYIS